MHSTEYIFKRITIQFAIKILLYIFRKCDDNYMIKCSQFLRHFDPIQLIFRIRAKNLISCFNSLINPSSELIDFDLQLSSK